MKSTRRLIYRLGALASAVLGAAWLLVAVVPSRGQQGGPAVRLVAMGPARRVGRTHVQVTFDLPLDHLLVRNPRVRVVNAAGNLIELLPILLRKQGPDGEGFRDLNSHTYEPGTYQVRLEMDYLNVARVPLTVASPWTSLTLPAPQRKP